MESSEFSEARSRLDKTQKQLAELLGTSLKAVHSYEQGWRKIPPHVERQLYFLLSRNQRKQDSRSVRNCWTIKSCPPKRKKSCPAWEFQAGKLCWFINGTLCECKAHQDWHEKMKVCRECEVLSTFI